MPSAIDLPLASKPRNFYITSTDMRSIVAGGEAAAALVLEKRGGPGPMLDHVFRVQLGKYTEPFHAQWHSRTEECAVIEVKDLRVPLAHRLLPDWVAASYDYEVVDPAVVLELKHSNARASFRDKADFYMPQLQWQMLVTGAKVMRFSVIPGNDDPVWGEVEADPVLQEMLLVQADDFRTFVESGADPVTMAPPAAGFPEAIKAVKIDGKRAYDWRKNNEWNAMAGAFIRARAVKPMVKDIEDKMKALVPADANEITGADVSCKRTKSGSITWQIDDGALEAAAVNAGIFINAPKEGK